MDPTTANSGALSELREAKFPPLDADFFSAFVPELAFAAFVGAFVALAYVFLSRLASVPLSKKEPSPELTKKGAAERAIGLIESLDPDDAEFAAKVWSAVRSYLSETYGNPFFPNMTASEAVRAAGNRADLVGLAELAREIEYSSYTESIDKKTILRATAITFLTARP